MAGIDAESSDLTARIQARRRDLVRSGQVEPLRPGERAVARGTAQTTPPLPQPVQRSRRSEVVVEFDDTPTPGGAAALAEASATDEVESGDPDDEQFATADPETALDLADLPPEEDPVENPLDVLFQDLSLQLSEGNAKIRAELVTLNALAQVADKRFTAVEEVLLLIAQHLSEAAPKVEAAVAVAEVAEPKRSLLRRMFWV
jgi:hypothetical protein